MLLKNSLIILCCLFSSAAIADRWFEVEVLIFKQRPAPYLQEDFSLKHPAIEAKKMLDLVTPALKAQAMQACLKGDPRFIQSSFTDSLINTHPRSFACDDSIDYLTHYDVLPITPEVNAQETMDKTYLLASEQLQFKAQRHALDKRGLAPILHTGWRFKGESESRSPSMYLIAGRQFNEHIIAAQRYSNDDFMHLINPSFTPSDRTDKQPITWQLEGLFKIHLRHYLFISADFDINERNDNGDLESARFAQFRRVFSEDIHYFDHPRMGMIVQIRKFNH